MATTSTLGIRPIALWELVRSLRQVAGVVDILEEDLRRAQALSRFELQGTAGRLRHVGDVAMDLSQHLMWVIDEIERPTAAELVRGVAAPAMSPLVGGGPLPEIERQTPGQFEVAMSRLVQASIANGSVPPDLLDDVLDHLEGLRIDRRLFALRLIEQGAPPRQAFTAAASLEHDAGTTAGSADELVSVMGSLAGESRPDAHFIAAATAFAAIYARPLAAAAQTLAQQTSTDFGPNPNEMQDLTRRVRQILRQALYDAGPEGTPADVGDLLWAALNDLVAQGTAETGIHELLMLSIIAEQASSGGFDVPAANVQAGRIVESMRDPEFRESLQALVVELDAAGYGALGQDAGDLLGHADQILGVAGAFPELQTVENFLESSRPFSKLPGALAGLQLTLALAALATGETDLVMDMVLDAVVVTGVRLVLSAVFSGGAGPVVFLVAIVLAVTSFSGNTEPRPDVVAIDHGGVSPYLNEAGIPMLGGRHNATHRPV